MSPFQLWLKRIQRKIRNPTDFPNATSATPCWPWIGTTTTPYTGLGAGVSKARAIRPTSQNGKPLGRPPVEEPTPYLLRTKPHPVIGYEGKRVNPVKILYANLHGLYLNEVPRLRHMCDTPCCVNPLHYTPTKDRKPREAITIPMTANPQELLSAWFPDAPTTLEEANAFSRMVDPTDPYIFSQEEIDEYNRRDQ